MCNRMSQRGRVLNSLGLLIAILVAGACRDESAIPTRVRALQLLRDLPPSPTACGIGCIVVSDRRGISVSLSSDSLGLVHLADTRMAGKFGDSVWVRLAGSETERALLPAAQSLIVSVGARRISLAMRDLALQRSCTRLADRTQCRSGTTSGARRRSSRP